MRACRTVWRRAWHEAARRAAPGRAASTGRSRSSAAIAREDDSWGEDEGENATEHERKNEVSGERPGDSSGDSSGRSRGREFGRKRAERKHCDASSPAAQLRGGERGGSEHSDPSARSSRSGVALNTGRPSKNATKGRWSSRTKRSFGCDSDPRHLRRAACERRRRQPRELSGGEARIEGRDSILRKIDSVTNREAGGERSSRWATPPAREGRPDC